MGMEYGLYESESHQFIWLGKRRFIDGRWHGFQMEPQVIAAFIAEHADYGIFQIHNDGGDGPPDWLAPDEWTKVASWHGDDGE